MGEVLFIERQKFSQWWIWLLLIGVGCIPVYGIYRQLFQGEEVGENPMSITGFIVLALFVLGLIALFVVMQLKTEITKQAISFQLYPFVNRVIKWEDVKEAKVIDYGFVGGWGIRWGTSYGTVYNIAGSDGMLLKLNNGEQLVIGTQQEEVLQSILQELRQKPI